MRVSSPVDRLELFGSKPQQNERLFPRHYGSKKAACLARVGRRWSVLADKAAALKRIRWRCVKKPAGKLADLRLGRRVIGRAEFVTKQDSGTIGGNHISEFGGAFQQRLINGTG